MLNGRHTRDTCDLTAVLLADVDDIDPRERLGDVVRLVGWQGRVRKASGIYHLHIQRGERGGDTVVGRWSISLLCDRRGGGIKTGSNISV